MEGNPEKAKIFGQFPSPHQHLNTMFGLGTAAWVLMLGCLLIYFRGSTDVDTQPPLRAQYCVDINCQGWTEFANLPSIGEKTGKSIVNHGQAIGGFRSANQLLDVKGVGEKTLAKIQPFLTIDNSGEDAKD